MFAIGFGVVAWGLFLWRYFGYPIWLTGSIGLVSFILGLITPRSRKVDLQPEPSGAVKLVVDKVMFRYDKLRFNNYELVFLDNRLVMKKLFSWTVTLATVLVSAAIGGFIGGLTGLCVEEFLDQRKRDKIRDSDELMTLSGGDMEILYENMSQVQLTGVSLKMVVRGRPMVFSMATEYPPLMARRVREVIPAQCWIHPPSSWLYP
jgi:hypothetical protein